MCHGHCESIVCEGEKNKMDMNARLFSLLKNFNKKDATEIFQKLVCGFEKIEDPTKNGKKMKAIQAIFEFISTIPAYMYYFQKIAENDIHNNHGEDGHKCKYHDADTLFMHLVLACINNINLEKNPKMWKKQGFLGLTHDIGKLVTQRKLPGGNKGFPYHGEKGAKIHSRIFKQHKLLFENMFGKNYMELIIAITSVHMHYYHSKEGTEKDGDIMESMIDFFSFIQKRFELNEEEKENMKNLFLNMFVSDNSAKKSHPSVAHKTKFATLLEIQNQEKRMRMILNYVLDFEIKTRVFFDYTLKGGLKKLKTMLHKMGYYNILVVDDNIIEKGTFHPENFKNTKTAIIVHTNKLIEDRESLSSIFKHNPFLSYNVISAKDISDTIGFPKGEVKYLCSGDVKPMPNDFVQGKSVIVL